MNIDRERTLEELEGEVWPPLKEYPTGLVARCYQLRKVPIDRLTAGDVRLLIGQSIGLEHLVPFAIEVLRADPYIEADLFPGDLLKNVKAIGEDYWKHHPEQHAEVLRLAARGV